MAAIATLDSVLPVNDTTNSTQIARGTVALSGNYPTGGDVLSFNLYGIQSNRAPVRVFIYEEPAAGAAPSGYVLGYAKGADNATGRLVVMQGAAALGPSSQLPAEAYPAGLTGAVIRFEAVFTLGQ